MDSFLLPSSLKVVDVQDTPDRLVVTVQDTRESVCCPSCGQPSRRIHSHYLRVTQDTAVGNRAVEMHLHVRRLRCDTATCSHLTFAETWPAWLDARVQRTSRLAQVQRSVGMALGGEAGKRLLTLLHEGTSGDTLLRLIRMQNLPEHPPPRILGVDDFCFRRGKTYGTLLIDLERHRVIDVLPDRLAATLAEWLTVHPGIEIISRDRYGDYARGAATGAPNAQQIADRFHLLKNLRDVSETWLKRHRAALVAPQPAVVTPREPSAVAVSPSTPPRNATVRRLTAVLDLRADRVARYERATALHAEGHSIRAVARLTGTGRTTIARWVKAGTYPHRASVLTGVAPYQNVIRERSLQQECTGKQIIEEVTAMGYSGSANCIYELLRWLRLGHVLPSIEDRQRQRTMSAVPTTTPYSAKQGAWLFIQGPEKLKTRDQERLTALYETVDTSRSVYTLVQEFAYLLRHRPQDAAARLKTWLVQAKASTVVELARFAQGIGKDLSAVMGAVTSSWSNGQVEGQVTRVKLLKRQMYGRAKFDLLRARILLA